MLQARPWIHANLVVVSSYHISIKFPMNGTIITVVGELDVEEECIISCFTPKIGSLVKKTPSTQASFKTLLYVGLFFSILY